MTFGARLNWTTVPHGDRSKLGPIYRLAVIESSCLVRQIKPNWFRKDKQEVDLEDRTPPSNYTPTSYLLLAPILVETTRWISLIAPWRPLGRWWRMAWSIRIYSRRPATFLDRFTSSFLSAIHLLFTSWHPLLPNAISSIRAYKATWFQEIGSQEAAVITAGGASIRTASTSSGYQSISNQWRKITFVYPLVFPFLQTKLKEPYLIEFTPIILFQLTYHAIGVNIAHYWGSCANITLKRRWVSRKSLQLFTRTRTVSRAKKHAFRRLVMKSYLWNGAMRPKDSGI